MIFSDVVVHARDKAPQIYFYPGSVFPPTDFHTATLIDETIWIIGGLGYQGMREIGVTPVYRLTLDTFEITRVETTGEAPGWINRHEARLEGKEIVVSGGYVSEASGSVGLDGTYGFDTGKRRWRRIA